MQNTIRDNLDRILGIMQRDFKMDTKPDFGPAGARGLYRIYVKTEDAINSPDIDDNGQEWIFFIIDANNFDNVWLDVEKRLDEQEK